MQRTLMVGLTERDLQAYVNALPTILKQDNIDFYWKRHFPLKMQYNLDWKSIEGTFGMKIAADIVSRGASLPTGTREAMQRVTGPIPKIAKKLPMNENELYEYQMLLAMTQGDAQKTALVKAWADDVKRVEVYVDSRIEWMALQSISTGKLTLTEANNNHVVTEYNVDYNIPSAQKVGYQTGSASWATAASAKPITKDFRAIIKAARAKGFAPRYALMNMSTFAEFAETAEVTALCSSYANNALQIAQAPGLEQVNAVLARTPYLYGLQIALIDQDIIIESTNGSRSSSNPFADNCVTFVESLDLGRTFYVPAVDNSLEGSPAIKVVRDYLTIKKYSEEEPVMEYTAGIANAFPAWENAHRSYLLDTHNSSWSH